ncbi:probable serine hydrolase [Stomoxys calcitrans]|uniref:probable serine hydrolase n=1 Tax=Stomoxys calcitrans TaxID=35570 RepID=UPI0027E28CB9|nr:probable serine hydrolase [Stomoxys calcitrans]
MENPTHECIEFQIPVPWGFLSCQWYGTRKVRPILALHGWQDNSGTWIPLLPYLPGHVGLFCVEFPGHGRSSKLPKGVIHHILDYINIVELIVKTFNWQKVSLLGHSLGGVVAYIYATLFPERIDLLIQLDVVKMPYRSPEFQLRAYRITIEKQLLEDERYDEEPTSYTFDELVELIHRGYRKSVNKENCKYLIERNCSRSSKDPSKLYFSTDPRIKYYVEIADQHEYNADFIKPQKNLNILMIRGTTTIYIDQESLDLLEVLKKQNPNMESYEVEGTHHVHMNSPKEVARYMRPFICKHRPPEESSSTFDANEQEECLKRFSKSKL